MIPSQLYGLFIGYTYVFITSKVLKLDPPGYEKAGNSYADIIEFVGPTEFFVYLVIAVANGGSFMWKFL